mmetsp:Transcript_39630/g.89888  ORF Transcript_39630/g.89888 Transcript_39630/m.89888 type:complete len:218 (-) Transcript_39630:81-734(-)
MDTAPLLRRLSQSKEHQAHVAARHLPLIEMNRPTVQGTSGPWGSRTAPSRAEATGAAALQLSAPEDRRRGVVRWHVPSHASFCLGLHPSWIIPLAGTTGCHGMVSLALFLHRRLEPNICGLRRWGADAHHAVIYCPLCTVSTPPGHHSHLTNTTDQPPGSSEMTCMRFCRWDARIGLYRRYIRGDPLLLREGRADSCHCCVSPSAFLPPGSSFAPTV